MPRRFEDLTLTDNFCGAGGNTEGAIAAGVELDIDVKPTVALNHWKRATTTYEVNYPNAKVECTDISACDPRRYPSTDLAVMSPECTTHTPAGGTAKIKSQLQLYEKLILDPAVERSRATTWDVVRFSEYHQYPIVVIENVIQLRDWPLYDIWLKAMYTLGYQHKTVYANSKFFWPTPQSRDRMYVVFWKKGNKAPELDYKPLSYCIKCQKDVHAIQTWKKQDKKYGIYGMRGQYVYKCGTCAVTVEPYYYAAFNAIDWSDKGTRIGDRKKELADNTKTRINHGLNKYGEMPFYIQHEQSSNIQNINPLYTALPTQSTRQTLSVVVPFIIGNYTPGWSKSSIDTFGTITTSDHHEIVTSQAFITQNKGESLSRPITDSLSTLTTKPYHGIVTTEAWNSFITYYNSGSNQTSSFYEAMGTLPTKERHAIVQYQKPNIEDCYYRMMKPHEGKRAMAFADNHIITGDSKEQFKQLGNAVTPPVMKWIIKQCIQTLL